MPNSLSTYTDYPCDLCGADEPIEIPCARLYTGNQPVHIARVWSDDLYGSVYTAIKHPAMMPRYTYVAAFLDTEVGLQGKKVCDIGAGEGLWLKYLRDNHSVEALGIEPSASNCERLDTLGIQSFVGTIEQFGRTRESKGYRADVATILWTLENCLSCIAMLKGAADVLPVGGKLIVATGSRILVPFKKPLFTYLSDAPSDVHCFRFSANSLQTALAKAGFKTIATNRYLDNDILCVLGEKARQGEKLPLKTDQPSAVHAFFERWHQESVHYLADRND
jgi:hypothetical protein